jgi:hypothetical protein
MTSKLVLERSAGAGIATAAAGVAEGNDDLMRMTQRAPEVSIPVASLAPGFRLRQAGTDAAHVRLLADAAASAKLPPILVQRRTSRIIDGTHRVEAAKLRGEWRIKARMIDCSDQQALVLAVQTNIMHGLPLSRADRIAGAKRILGEHADWSDRAVATITGLSAKAVASLRNASTGDLQFHGKRLGRDGKRRPAQPGEGRRRAAEYIAVHPEASLREVARATDVSLGTVHDVRERIRRGTLTLEPTGQQAGPGQAPAAPEPATPATIVTAGSAASQAMRPIQLGRVLPRPGSRDGQQVIRPGSRDAQQVIWSAIGTKLAADPALRYTNGGRAFLRWMTQHSTHADEWREFVDAIPEHWRHEVGRIARTMSEEWRQFADQLRGSQEIAS